MKHFFSLLLLLCGMSAFAQVVDIPDAKFREALLYADVVELYTNPGIFQPIDQNNDSLIQAEEAANVKSLLIPVQYSIQSIEGISFMQNIQEIEIQVNPLDSVDISSNKRLKKVRFMACNINNINLNGLDSIVELNLATNRLVSIEINHLKALEILNLNQNLITSIDINSNLKIKKFTCFNSKLASLDLSNLDSLTDVDASFCNLQSVQLTNLPALVNLSVSYNPILKSLDIKNLPNLELFICDNSGLESLKVSNLPKLDRLFCRHNMLQSLDCSDISSVKIVNCKANKISNLKVNACKNLGWLDCSSNKLLTLNIDSLINLTQLICSENFMLSPNLTNNVNLRSLSMENNALTEINTTNNLDLERLALSNNLLTSLEVNHLRKLNSLFVNSNNLSYLNTDSLQQLSQFHIDINQLETLDLSNNKKLTRLSCVYNKLKFLDLNQNLYLRNLDCSNNQLEYLYIKNTNSEEDNLEFGNNLDLIYICCDEIQFSDILVKTQQYGNTQTVIGSYCNFDPGGPVYNFQSQTRYDADLNNCTTTDPGFTTKYQITDSIGLNQQVTPFEGVVKMALNAGQYNIKPIIDTVLFNIEPKSVAVDFPAMSSPYLFDFCVAPINVVHDLEVQIIPITPLRPGFDARFKLVCTNKGNQTTTGSVSLVYDEDRLDFISSDISASTQNAGFVSWNFTNLHPNASFEAEITFNCNSPVETPAVNIGDILSFYAEAIGLTPETTPANNTFALRQTVVGSYDPNDKTCLQGERLDPDMVGQYVHYLIRFENTGTYPAEFVVVKDVINASTFDINTLEIVDASHPMYARITQGNVVEFIFENINLPFDDANNDGYVAFKIKTQPWLKIGDTLANTAAIYFDYNHPIITNTAQTVVAPLVDTQSPGTPFAVRMTPNPATNRVYFQSEAAIERVALSSTEGRLLYSGPLTNGALSLENVAPGVYWVRVFTETGTQTLKLIKS